MSSRERRRLQTRADLLASAREVFAESGFAGASLDEIARRAGFTKGALYGHFDNKDDLFLALLDHETRALEQSITASARPGSGIAGLRMIARGIAEALPRDRDWALAVTEFSLHAARQPELAGHRREALRESGSQLTAIFGSVLSRSLDERTVGPLAIAAIDGLMLQSALDDSLDLGQLVTIALERLITMTPDRSDDPSACPPLDRPPLD